jgi:mannosyl-oligosaccharide alpha-1,2-mannosidase
MTKSVRSRKNGTSRVDTKHATSSVGSTSSGAPSTRKTLSFVGAILFGASFVFWLFGNIKLSEVKWKSPSPPEEEWQERREQVRDAFISSWDAYTKYAWGELVLQSCSKVVPETNLHHQVTTAFTQSPREARR